MESTVSIAYVEIPYNSTSTGISRNASWTHAGTSQYVLEKIGVRFTMASGNGYSVRATEVIGSNYYERMRATGAAANGDTITVAFDSAAWTNKTSGAFQITFFKVGGFYTRYNDIALVLTYRNVADESTVTVQTAIAGDPQTVSITNVDPDVYHTVRWQYPGSIDSGTQTYSAATRNPAWAVPSGSLTALFQASPNSGTVTGTVTVATYTADGTLVGSSDYDAVLLLPENDTTRPTISAATMSVNHDATASAIYAVTGNAYVQGHSTGVYEVTAAGYQGAGIASIRVVLPEGGLLLTNGEGEAVINTAGRYAVGLEVTDTRGFVRTVAEQWVVSSVQAYSAPAVTSLQAFRCDAMEQPAEDGGHVRILAAAVMAAISDTLTMTATVTEKGGSNVASGTLTNGAVTLGQGYLNENKSYEITVRATDAFGIYSETKIEVGTGIMTMTRLKGGKGVAFGMMAKRMGVEVREDWPVYMHGQEILRLIVDIAHPPGSSMETVEAFDPNTEWPWTVWFRDGIKWTRGV